MSLIYEYRARVISVYDADTVWLDVDLGIDTHHRLSIRLAGLDTPELPTPEGKAARDFTVAWLANVGQHLVLRTIKDRREKYGRYLGELVDSRDGSTLNDALLDAGHAVPYDGGPR